MKCQDDIQISKQELKELDIEKQQIEVQKTDNKKKEKDKDINKLIQMLEEL